MAGFQPMFPGLVSDASRGAASQDGTPERPSTTGFTSLFGGPAPESAATGSTAPAGFTSLLQSMSAPAPIVEEGPGPVDLDEVIESARAEGREQARAEAQADLDEMQARLDALMPALDQLATLRTTALRQAADDVGRVVLQACRHILKESLAIHPDALSRVVRDAMSQLPDDDDLRILVSADDVPRVRDAVGDRFEDRVEADPGIEAGCRVEARQVSVDATLDAALEGIEHAVSQWAEQQS